MLVTAPRPLVIFLPETGIEPYARNLAVLAMLAAHCGNVLCS